jgi:hypothetical protein
MTNETSGATESKYGVRVRFAVSPERTVAKFDTLAQAERRAWEYDSDSRGIWIDCPDGKVITIKEGR